MEERKQQIQQQQPATPTNQSPTLQSQSQQQPLNHQKD